MGYSQNRGVWNWVVILALVFGLGFAGCGGSEEATSDQAQASEQAQPLGQEQEQPAPKNADDDALTSFIGQAPAKEEAQQPAAQQAPQTGQLGAYEKQIEDLRTENTTLKQRLVKLEQDNRTLNTMVADNEQKIQASRDRADSLEAALMARPVAAAPATDTAPQTQPAEQAETGMNSTAITSYEDALRAFNARRYDEAINSLSAMLSSGVEKDLEDNCNYWIGESEFAKRRYKDAISSFEKVLAYKVSEKKGDAQYMMAQCYERLGDKAKAKEGYEKVVKEYPLSSVVKKAKERWARL